MLGDAADGATGAVATGFQVVSDGWGLALFGSIEEDGNNPRRGPGGELDGERNVTAVA